MPDFGLRTWGYRIRGARWAISDFGLSDFGLECFRFSYKPLPDFGLWDFGLWDFRLCPDLGFRTMDLGLGLAGPPTWPMVRADRQELRFECGRVGAAGLQGVQLDLPVE